MHCACDADSDRQCQRQAATASCSATSAPHGTMAETETLVATGYLPTATEWETIDPAAAGFDPARLREAVDFALQSETDYAEPEGDMAAFLLSGGMHGNNPEAPGHRDIIGPTVPRGNANGMIIRGGRIVAEWGDTDRVDMTFSATKSYLSTMVGLAWGEGLMDLDDQVGDKVHDGGFEGDHNSKITWRHMLHQASEW